MSIIELQNVGYTYQQTEIETVALRDVNLTVEQGEFVALLGRNGSGKSTLAKLLNGLLLPTNGNVLVKGMNTKSQDDLYKIRCSVAMVFQNPDNQMIASIVEDDIAFGPENLGVPREEIEERVTWALNAVGMTHARHDTPFKMSGGQKQRIAIAAVLAMKPEVLVLDESTAMLDPVGRREIMDVLHKLNREDGLTVLLITHYMDEALEADRVVVMHDGTAAKNLPPDELFSQGSRLHELGLELPPLLEIQKKLADVGVELPYEIKSARELAEVLCL